MDDDDFIELVPPLSEVPSPCTGVCTIADDDLCLGCARTVGEIAEWYAAEDSRRRAILEEVAARAIRR